VAGRWFSPDTPVSSINKTDLHNITEILLKPDPIIHATPCYHRNIGESGIKHHNTNPILDGMQSSYTIINMNM
jgi:hypothetical protein